MFRNSFRRVCPPPPAAQQVDIGTHLGQRVARRFDSLHPRDRVEDDLSTLWGQLVDTLGEGDGPEIYELTSLRPDRGGVGDFVLVLGHLHKHAKFDRPPASRSDISAARKSAVFSFAWSGVRYSVPASGRRRNRPNRLCPSAFVNLKAVTAKYACRAKLNGIGFGASTNALADGWEARNATMGGGEGAPGPLDATTARMNSRNSSPVRVGNPL